MNYELSTNNVWRVEFQQSDSDVWLQVKEKQREGNISMNHLQTVNTWKRVERDWTRRGGLLSFHAASQVYDTTGSKIGVLKIQHTENTRWRYGIKIDGWLANDRSAGSEEIFCGRWGLTCPKAEPKRPREESSGRVLRGRLLAQSVWAIIHGTGAEAVDARPAVRKIFHINHSNTYYHTNIY